MRAALLLFISVMALIASEGASVDELLKRFEEQIAKDFVPIQHSLDQWRSRRVQSALSELQSLLSKATPEDQVVIAYHLLATNPTHKQARELFTKGGLTPPFDEKGVAAPGWSMPATSNRALADKITNLAYPPFEVVREAIDPKSASVSGFWKKESAQTQKLKTDLIEIAKQGQADVAYPLLAYYQPFAKEVQMYFKTKGKDVPRQRTWFSPVDRWLLDHELAGIDCLSPAFKPSTGTAPALVKGEPAQVSACAWKFPDVLPACRVECAATWNDRVAFTIADDHQSGVRLSIVKQSATIGLLGKSESLGQFTLNYDPTTVSMPMQFEVRGKEVTVRIGGVVLGSATLPRSMAFSTFSIEGSLRAAQLRLRYLAELPEIPPTGAAVPPVAVKPPPEPAWKAERTAQLAKPVSFVFTETSLEDVAGMLSRLSGSTFTLDGSAEPLKDLPVSLTAHDLKLQTALEWLQRLTEITAVPTEQGFSLQWKR